MNTPIPHSPWGNPTLEEGHYEAMVQSIQHVDYGDDNGSMLELTFRLQSRKMPFVSRVYLTPPFPSRSQHRLWYLCQALGLEDYELKDDPDAAVGRKLVLDVTTIHPTTANRGQPYSDVRRFLPYVENEQEVSDSAKNVTE